MATYNIARSLQGHGGAIRAICEVGNVLVTGSMDAAVYVWSSSSSIEQSIFDHNHWVTALTTLAPNHVQRLGAPGFVSGSMDTCLRVYLKGDDGFACAMVLKGHTSGVISLAWQAASVLLSGSWDGTCRGWDLVTQTCTFVLPNHENGVCVLGLDDGTIVTGSTGRQEGNQVIDAVVRIWKTSQSATDYSVQSTLTDHQGPVRGLVAVPDIGFASCSNDGSVKLWTATGEVLMNCSHPLNHEGKPGFVLGLAYLPESRLLVSASEDCTACVWSLDGSLLQTIAHPQGLWTVAPLADGLFVTGGDDKVARVFSTDASMDNAAAEILALQEQVAEAAKTRQSGPSNVDIEKLPDYFARATRPGSSDGFIQMFRKGSVAFACQWSGPSQTWLDIGEVTGTGSGGVIDGESFDLVIPVELETPNGLRKLQIGYNQGQNPFQVAQAFIDKHMLQQGYLKEIADFITAQSGSYQAPVLGSSASAPAAVSPQAFASAFFPVKTYGSFDSTKVAKLHATVVQFNTAVAPEMALTGSELDLLAALLTTLTQTSYYHSSKVTTDQVRVALKMVEHWPAAQVFPALDVCRLLALHPAGADALSPKAAWLRQRCLAFGTSVRRPGLTTDVLGTDVAAPNPTRMLAWRVLCNFCVHAPLRAVVVAAAEVESALTATVAAGLGNKTLAVTLATLALNLSVAVAAKERTATAGLAPLLATFVAPAAGALDDDTFGRIVLAIGTLGSVAPQLWAALPSAAVLRDRAAAFGSSPAVGAIVSDVASAASQ
ncbi:phospholipase A-2-activating protein [Achlya hypogyna]|uniref:Phospholipase A-2-activating protein n=1 Tax=Achlya hypogyna TaxID=1202772 RepID=A0A1V9YM21_ACHHY|nr:phospholipase A-2-activating protein [Achlya hypogyna]